jgi:thiol-disulfide isomerase/thioredoxin
MSGLANPGGLLGPGRRRPVGAVVRAMPYGQPALEQLARDLAGKVKLVKVNVDTSPQISQRFAVQAIPTLLVLRHGQVAPADGRRPPGYPAGGFGPLVCRAAVPRVPSVLVLGPPQGRVAGANGISRDGPSARIERALRGMSGYLAANATVYKHAGDVWRGYGNAPRQYAACCQNDRAIALWQLALETSVTASCW